MVILLLFPIKVLTNTKREDEKVTLALPTRNAPQLSARCQEGRFHSKAWNEKLGGYNLGSK